MSEDALRIQKRALDSLVVMSLLTWVFRTELSPLQEQQALTRVFQPLEEYLRWFSLNQLSCPFPSLLSSLVGSAQKEEQWL